MNKRYQIKKRRALQEFCEWAGQNEQSIQMPFPIASVVELAKQGLGCLLREVGKSFVQTMLETEVEQLVGKRSKLNRGRQAYRWGTQDGYCIIDGQKVPIPKPRVRGRDGREVPLGSYELFQKASLMEDAVWVKIMHGLTMRSYKEVLQQFADAYGIEKSTVSEHFIECSRKKLDELLSRKLDKLMFCAIFIDGIIFEGEHMIVVIGLDCRGFKHVLGLRQGATENSAVTSELLADLAERGLDFSIPRLYVLDGSKALRAAVVRHAGNAAFIQRCQIHKIRNVMQHLSQSHQYAFRFHMRAAYCNVEFRHAKNSLLNLVERLEKINPSAAESLNEGLEDTLMVNRLGVPTRLRATLATTNVIESGFSVVEQICRRVKSWQGGDHRLRWAASALCYVESRWARIRGYREIPHLVNSLKVLYDARLQQLKASQESKKNTAA